MSEEKRGRFIVFEGIDGSGKTTQIRLLRDRLTAEARKVHLTAEPTQSVTGGLLRDALSGVQQRSPAELAALFLLDRINHNVNPQNGIRKLLGEGYDVICDRYYYSSLAYQGSEADFGWVRNINLGCSEIRRPDICIFLDLDPDIGLSRIENRAITEIYEEKNKLQKIRGKYFEAFASLGDEENIRIINADRPADEVSADIFAAVSQL